MSFETDVARLLRGVLDRLVDNERRIGGLEFRGTVAEVDGQRHAIRMVIGQTPEGDDVLSPWVPVSQTAGAMKFHDLPSVGQQGVLRSANGDIQQSSFQPLHWSDDNPALSDDPSVKIMTFGGVTVSWDDAKLKAAVGGSFIEIVDGKITVSANHTSMLGASHTHNNVNVGDTHKHDGVEKGSDLTGLPS